MPDHRDQSSEPAVCLLATFNTKGREAAYLAGLLTALGVRVTRVDVSCQHPSSEPVDVSPQEVLVAADSAQRADEPDRGVAVGAMARAAAAWIGRAHQQRRVAGVISLGGSAGTTIGTAAMRALPIGVPKLMVSTLASGQVRHYVGDKDIVMVNSVVDLSGLNRVTRSVLRQAACAMAGMVSLKLPIETEPQRPLVAATMFGVTTPCVEAAKEVLERAGFEVLVFHATGNGGQAMESLIDEGLFDGVLDITTTELADELIGGVLSAGPDRLTAAGRRGIPQVVSAGATDMVNFHGPATIAPQFAGRTFHQHNPNVTLMRTTPDECARIGADMARKLSAATGPVAVLLPARGVSAIDGSGRPFDDPLARRALADALRAGAPDLEIDEADMHINDQTFAVRAAERLLEMMAKRRS
jgi:uncharacterized protein (UPF0261 family)